MQHPTKAYEPLDPENPERRQFALQSILAMLAGVTITITGCGDDDSSPTSPSPSGNDRAGAVSANHGHAATVTSAQLTAGNAVVLNIRGTATHPHTVELSATEVGQIGAGQRVTKVSSTDDSSDAGRHSHEVTFN
jgi:hypothetical protein